MARAAFAEAGTPARARAGAAGTLGCVQLEKWAGALELSAGQNSGFGVEAAARQVLEVAKITIVALKAWVIDHLA
jgi:hypothetical protein